MFYYFSILLTQTSTNHDRRCSAHCTLPLQSKCSKSIHILTSCSPSILNCYPRHAQLQNMIPFEVGFSACKGQHTPIRIQLFRCTRHGFYQCIAFSLKLTANLKAINLYSKYLLFSQLIRLFRWHGMLYQRMSYSYHISPLIYTCISSKLTLISFIDLFFFSLKSTSNVRVLLQGNLSKAGIL